MSTKRIIVTLSAMALSAGLYAQNVTGVVTDKKDQQPLVGAVVEVTGTALITITDIDGKFSLRDISTANCDIRISYVGYSPVVIENIATEKGEPQHVVRVAMQEDTHKLEGVTVVGYMRNNTELANIQQTKNSNFITNNISAQEISKTQDTNAGEVIRRVPGVSLIDDKFVMVRGLSQRYNNVWVNGGAVPSSEADSRAFSFDLIPSNQIDNLTIIKTPSAEYPADYCGGFILVNTKDIPEDNKLSLSVTGNWNDKSSFASFRQNQRSSSWLTHDFNPLGDFKASVAYNHKWNWLGGQLGLIATANYSSDYKTYKGMVNNLFGAYDAHQDKSNYLRNSVDDQYNHNQRLGGLLNITWRSADGRQSVQLKNIANHITNNRYTWRDGISAQANQERSAEYYYRSRMVYNGQLTGKHTFGDNLLDWSLSTSFANRNTPDRRRYLIDDAIDPGVYALTTGNDISREWTRLKEYNHSLSVNDKQTLYLGNWEPVVKAGAYVERRSRNYTTQELIYNWDAANNQLPSDFRHADLPTLLSNPDNYGDNKFTMLELSQWRNNYRGRNTLEAGYATINLPLGKLSAYLGARYEHNDMELISNTRDTEKSESSRHYRSNYLLPSLNTTWKFNNQHQLRFSYGQSINRPEFREMSSSVYYDFDLASDVQGNTELKDCKIHNLDLRYEYYPSSMEKVSLALFYKHFDSPIEWTYTVSGGTDLIYSYKNAKSANNYGLELDIRKDLSFLGLPGLGWSFNGALIKSKVLFEADSKERNRPMQGQSPYLVNTGFFYQNDTHHLNVAILYNRIGKRIIGVGRSEGSTGDDNNSYIPDSYEMPRDMIDLSLSKKWGIHWETKAYLRDLLAQKVDYKQFADVTLDNGTRKTVEEITRQYKPGRNFGIQIIYSF
jgi:Outer membrane receptor proteins, mostly Fe transport